MFNQLFTAAQIIQEDDTSWGKGTTYGYSYDSENENREKKFACLFGFLARAAGLNWEEVKDYTRIDALGRRCDLEAQRVLADVIVEVSGDHPRWKERGISNLGDLSFGNIIVFWNDRIAESADEVIAMLEKAGARLDERAGL